MGFQAFRDAGVAQVLRHAKVIITERGHAKGVIYDPATGNVDVRGALLLAAGAKPANIIGFNTSPESAHISIFYIPKVYAAIEMIEGIFGDIEEWNDTSDLKQIQNGFNRLANLIEISIT